MKILLPISLDRWRNPIATLLRACVVANPELEFHSYSNPLSDEDRELGAEFWSLPHVFQAAQSKLALTRFDLVHTASITWHNQAAVMAAKLRSFRRARYLATINLQVGPSDGSDWTLLQCAESLADGLVSVSEAAGSEVRKRCPDRFRGVIPNGFDAGYFDPSIEDDTALPEKIRNFPTGSFALYLGALEPRKNPDFVVELARRHPEIPFVGVGYVHPLGRHFEPMVRSLPNFHWLGHVDRRCVRALLRHAGVLLFPSEREGLALSVIEALGMGLPVIGQPKSSMPELIHHGVNGMLIDIGTIDEWSHAMLSYLARTPEERSAHRAHIRPCIVAAYDWPVIGRRYGELYRSMA